MTIDEICQKINKWQGKQIYIKVFWAIQAISALTLFGFYDDHEYTGLYGNHGSGLTVLAWLPRAEGHKAQKLLYHKHDEKNAANFR